MVAEIEEKFSLVKLLPFQNCMDEWESFSSSKDASFSGQHSGLRQGAYVASMVSHAMVGVIDCVVDALLYGGVITGAAVGAYGGFASPIPGGTLVGAMLGGSLAAGVGLKATV